MTNAPTIPIPQLPTDDELRQWTLPKWKAVEPVLLTSLAPELLPLTIPTMFQAIRTTDIIDHWLPGFDKPSKVAAETLVGVGREALTLFPAGFFFKMDSRSPKDCGIVRFDESNLDDLPSYFFSSMRMLDDLADHRFHRDHYVLCFRQWMELRDEQRVFVKDGNIQGISRYDYFKAPDIDYTDAHIERITSDARRYLEAILPHMPIRDFVFDFAYLPDGETILIELNPYGLSDPCCFKRYERISGYAWEVA